MRTARDGKPGASFPVAVDAKAPEGETPATWVRVTLLGHTVGTVAPRLMFGRLSIKERDE